MKNVINVKHQRLNPLTLSYKYPRCKILLMAGVSGKVNVFINPSLICTLSNENIFRKTVHHCATESDRNKSQRIFTTVNVQTHLTGLNIFCCILSAILSKTLKHPCNIPHKINVQFAPCQIPLTRNTIKVFK